MTRKTPLIAALVCGVLISPAVTAQQNDDPLEARRQRLAELREQRRLQREQANQDHQPYAAQDWSIGSQSSEAWWGDSTPTNSITLAGEHDGIAQLTFWGGTLGDLLNLMATVMDVHSLNIVLKRDALNLPVEPLRLRNVSFDVLLDYVAPNEGTSIRSEADGTSWVYHLSNKVTRPLGNDEKSQVIRTIAYSKTPFVEKESSPLRSTEVFSLAEIAGHPERGAWAVSTFLDLAQSTVGQAGGGDGAELTYHEPSGIMVARLTPSEFKTLERAFNAFMADEQRRQTELHELERDAIGFRGDRDRARNDVLAAMEMIERLEEQVAALKELAKRENHPDKPTGTDAAFVTPRDTDAEILTLRRRIAERELILNDANTKVAEIEERLKLVERRMGMLLVESDH